MLTETESLVLVWIVVGLLGLVMLDAGKPVLKGTFLLLGEAFRALIAIAATVFLVGGFVGILLFGWAQF